MKTVAPTNRTSVFLLWAGASQRPVFTHKIIYIYESVCKYMCRFGMFVVVFGAAWGAQRGMGANKMDETHVSIELCADDMDDIAYTKKHRCYFGS